MSLNVELLQRTMAYIDAHPEQHDQGEWVERKPECGTAACFAGWAAILEFGEGVIFDDGEMLAFRLPAPYSNRRDDGLPPLMSQQAARLLGLSSVQADTLFNAWNTRGMLRAMVNDLVATGDLAGDVDWYEAEVGQDDEVAP